MATNNLEAMQIIGVTGTTNETSAFADIGALWAQAATSAAFGDSEEAYAVYHDYAMRPGGYTCRVTIGRKAAIGEAVPPGASSVIVPKQDCVVVPTDGSIPQVQKAWADLWSRWPDGGPRTFIADLEIWRMGPKSAPPGTMLAADIYIGVRSSS
jgi:predicted transcriptional regulator YdeE